MLFTTVSSSDCLWYPRPLTRPIQVFVVKQALLRGYLWFALSLNVIRPGQPWLFYPVCFSHIPFARPADHNASPAKATLLTMTTHAIPLRVRVFVAIQGGPAYRIVSALLTPVLGGISALVADPAVINYGLLLASAQVSALITHVSR